MVSDIDILTQASAMARHAEKRHAIVAENIANADTPGYRARALPNFDPDMALNASHTVGIDNSAMMRPIDKADAPASPNGNTVSLDQQMVEAAEAQAQHQTALAFYRKAIDMLRISFSTQG